MRELNEQELAQAGGAAGAAFGVAGSSSITDSSLGYNGSNSFAANKSSAFGYQPVALSNAASTSGLTISAS